MLHRHQNGAPPFAADAKALGDPQHEQRDCRPNADGLVGRQQADEECADAHDKEREDEHLLAPDAIAKMTE